MVEKHTFAISRRNSPEVCHQRHALSNQRAQGKPDARCTRGLVCNKVVENAHEHTGPAETSDFPCAVALRLLRGLPGEPCSLPPSPAGVTASLTPSSGVSGPYDLAVRFGIARLARRRVHRNPPRVRDVRETPL